MKTQIRLNSVVPNGVSGPEAGAIDLIYGFLLSKYHQNAYGYISINQIGNDLNEVFIRKAKQVYLNIRIQTASDFDTKSNDEKNRLRLEVMHEGMLRIAQKEKKIEVSVLEEIKKEILENNFLFDFQIKIFPNKKNKNLEAKLIVQPLVHEFKYYIEVLDGSQIKCRKQIYSGMPVPLYVSDLFKTGVWKNENKFILKGVKSKTEIHFTIDECSVEYINLSANEKDPFFEMFKAGISDQERNKVWENYKSSLPLSIQAVLREDGKINPTSLI